MTADRFNYLWHLLGWALPVLLIQLGLLAFVHRGQLRRVLRAVLPPVFAVTAWLVAADHLAIRAGIWRFDRKQLLGIHLGAVPLEEALFFLLTNLLVGLGLVLFWRAPR